MERDLAKVEAAGSSPVSRSFYAHKYGLFYIKDHPFKGDFLICLLFDYYMDFLIKDLNIRIDISIAREKRLACATLIYSLISSICKF